MFLFLLFSSLSTKISSKNHNPAIKFNWNFFATEVWNLQWKKVGNEFLTIANKLKIFQVKCHWVLLNSAKQKCIANMKKIKSKKVKDRRKNSFFEFPRSPNVELLNIFALAIKKKLCKHLNFNLNSWFFECELYFRMLV